MPHISDSDFQKALEYHDKLHHHSPAYSLDISTYFALRALYFLFFFGHFWIWRHLSFTTI
jgi:hypothetical protein